MYYIQRWRRHFESGGWGMGGKFARGASEKLVKRQHWIIKSLTDWSPWMANTVYNHYKELLRLVERLSSI